MTSRIAEVQKGRHLDFLDGLRGFAVSYVLLYHFFPKTLSLTHSSFVYKIWDTFWLMGWSGVDLFFVLSGFLITGVLYKAKTRQNYFKNFYIRRFLRIFPAYYLLIIISVFYFYPEKLSPYYWLYLSNFDVELSIPFNDFLCIAWSLSIEEQYYLIYPALVYFLKEKDWFKLLGGFIFLSFALRLFGHYFGFFVPRQMYHNTLAHLDGIALGGLLRLMLFRYDDFKTFISGYVKLTPALLILAAGLGYYCGSEVLKLSVGADGAVNLGHVSFFPPMYMFGYTLNAAVFGGLILRCIFTDGLTFKIFSNPILRNLGKYSYGMYLFQFPALFFFNKIAGDYQLALNPLLTGGLLFLACYLFARASWLLVESPMAKLKDRLTRHRTPQELPQRPKL